MGTIFTPLQLSYGTRFQKSKSWAPQATSFCTEPGLLPALWSGRQPLQSTSNSTSTWLSEEVLRQPTLVNSSCPQKKTLDEAILPSLLLYLDSHWKIHLHSLLFPPLGTLWRPSWPSLPSAYLLTPQCSPQMYLPQWSFSRFPRPTQFPHWAHTVICN